MATNGLNHEQIISGFEITCRAEGKSPKTIEWYICFLRRFAQFIKQHNFPDDPCRIEKQHIREFILFLQTEAKTPRTNKPLSPTTVQGYVRTLKVFYSWLYKEDYVKYNMMAGMPIPKASVKVIDTFTAEQIARIVAVCHRTNENRYRNLAILLLLLDSGVRVSELAGIELDDVDLIEGYIKIKRAKGGRERVVPLGSLVQKTLWKYMNHYRPEPVTDRITKLFLSDKGLPLTRNGIQQMVRRYGKKAGISGVRCSPHTFRHTFAKNYLLNGGDIFSLQKILGHTSLASVRMYLNLFAIDIKKQHQRFSPVDTIAETSGLYHLIGTRNHE